MRSVLMKGIFSTFGSVKSPLLHRTGNKMRSCFLFPFKEKALLVIEEGPSCRNETKEEDRVTTKRLFCLQTWSQIKAKGFIMIVVLCNNLIID